MKIMIIRVVKIVMELICLKMSGIAGMDFGIENEKDIEEYINGQPTGEAAKFYHLLKEY